MSPSTWAKVKAEFGKLVPPTVFFFIALHIIALVRSLMTMGSGIATFSSLQIAIASLILGKAVLIADLWPAINRFPEKPLIFNIGWKTAIYFVVASVIHYLERLYDAAKVAGGIVAGNEHLLKEIVWPHFWAIQIVVAVIIFNYCVIRELGRALGEERMIRLFFSDLAPALRSPDASERTHRHESSDVSR